MSKISHDSIHIPRIARQTALNIRPQPRPPPSLTTGEMFGLGCELTVGGQNQSFEDASKLASDRRSQRFKRSNGTGSRCPLMFRPDALGARLHWLNVSVVDALPTDHFGRGASGVVVLHVVALLAGVGLTRHLCSNRGNSLFALVEVVEVLGQLSGRSADPTRARDPHASGPYWPVGSASRLFNASLSADQRRPPVAPGPGRWYPATATSSSESPAPRS